MGKWRSLLDWYSRAGRDLPWRNDSAPYRVWVSEIMLQQTQVATVIPYFNRFMESFATVEDLAAAPEERVLGLWAGLGYYSRARNLHRGAKHLAERLARGEGFPRTVEGWLEVPGVGPYTAGAVVSIAFNEAVPILDGNVERVLSRLERVSDAGTGKRELWRLATEAVQAAAQMGGKPRDFNQALMELGATVCTPRNPLCESCPVETSCEARKEGDWESFPPKKARKEWLQVQEEVHCLVDPEGRIWLEQSDGERAWRKGLWDLPRVLPAWAKKAEELGRIETRYVVTRHKVTRGTRVYRSHSSWSAAEVDGGAWAQVHSEGFFFVDGQAPVGAPLKKAWAKIAAEFPGLR
ncbi:MAG TPA: A/G-specific adenine glycosylase [Bdellovibrionota bacterium]|jgi:A/G-specific adenine glycosylase|nr:A/G-specific adenine glycosylase [Bdellovibrionota bacterium]